MAKVGFLQENAVRDLHWDPLSELLSHMLGYVGVSYLPCPAVIPLNMALITSAPLSLGRSGSGQCGRRHGLSSVQAGERDVVLQPQVLWNGSGEVGVGAGWDPGWG